MATTVAELRIRGAGTVYSNAAEVAAIVRDRWRKPSNARQKSVAGEPGSVAIDCAWLPRRCGIDVTATAEHLGGMRARRRMPMVAPLAMPV